MISKMMFQAAKDRSTKLLESRGFEPVLHVFDHFLYRYIHPHLIGQRSNYEVLCVKIKHATGVVSLEYVRSHCPFEICQLRSLLTMYPGDMLLRCEIWVLSPNGSIHCYDVTAEDIREVAACAQ
jgi:hypothetical protein